MHFGSVLALSLAAGFRDEVAVQLATYSQMTDDWADINLPYHVTTASHTASIKNLDISSHIHTWIPFHFLPGGEGETVEEMLICRKNSKLAQQMVHDHIEFAIDLTKDWTGAKDLLYAPHLLGIMLHVYADTFAHYGFSGTTSKNNKIKDINILGAMDAKTHLWEKAIKKENIGAFRRRYWREIGDNSFWHRLYRRLRGETLEAVSRALGHAAAYSYPDISWLHFEIEYDDGRIEERNNPETYMDFLKNTFEAFQVMKDKCRSKPDSYVYSAWFSADKVEYTWESISQRFLQSVIYPHNTAEDSMESWMCLAKQFGGHSFLPYNDYIIDKAKEVQDVMKKRPITKLDARILRYSNTYYFSEAALAHRSYVLCRLLPEHSVMVLLDA